MSARIQWIDYSKFIGIVMVILGHLYLNNKYITNFIYSFHMPFFFFLSGGVINTRQYKTIQDNTRQLLFPYIFFYILTYFWWLIITYPAHPELYSSGITDAFFKPLVGIFMACSYNTKISIMPNAPLWFLPTLFLCKSFFYFSNKYAVDNRMKLIINLCSCSIFLILSKFLSVYRILLPFALPTFLVSYTFFILGHYFIHFFVFINTKKFLVKLVIGCVLLTLTMGLSKIAGRVDLASLSFSNFWLFYITALLGTSGMILLCQCIKLPSFMSIVWGNTLLIMCMQGMLLTIITRLSKLLFNFDYLNLSFTQGGLITMMVILFSIPIIFIITMFFPFIVGKSRKRNWGGE